MAKDLVINGVTYNEVNELSVPTSGGDKAKFVDKDELATLDKVKSIDTWNTGASNVGIGNKGVTWEDGFAFYSENDLDGDDIATGGIHQRIPLVAGKNVEFEVDEDNQVVKVNTSDKLSKTAVITTNEEQTNELNVNEFGIGWHKGFVFYDEDDNPLSVGTIIQWLPLVAGGNIEFEVDKSNSVIKIKAKIPVSSVNGKTGAVKIDVPTKTSELTNDSGFLTAHQSLVDYAKKSELPTKTSQLNNDSGFLTSIPSEYVTETELAAKKYLTAVPSEYVTETELSGKGYAVKSSAETWTFKLKDGSTVPKKVVLA